MTTLGDETCTVWWHQEIGRTRKKKRKRPPSTGSGPWGGGGVLRSRGRGKIRRAEGGVDMNHGRITPKKGGGRKRSRKVPEGRPNQRNRVHWTGKKSLEKYWRRGRSRELGRFTSHARRKAPEDEKEGLETGRNSARGSRL